VANRDATVASREPVGLPTGDRFRRDPAKLELAKLGQHVLVD
jgi:hypothetical protein